MAGYKTTVVAANWPSIQEAARLTSDLHGRWPTHYAIPKKGISDELVRHLQGSLLREMGDGITGQGDKVFLGFSEEEHAIKKEPSWMSLAFDEPELEEMTEVAKQVEEPADTEEADAFYESLQEAGRPIVIMNEADILAHFGEIAWTTQG